MWFARLLRGGAEIPTPEEITPARGSFLAHSNYIRAFHHIIACHAPARGASRLRTFQDVYQAVANAVRASPQYSRLRARPHCDMATVASALRSAWSAEAMLAATAEFGEHIIGTANNWAVIQAYYSSYHAAQALAVANGNVRAKSHEVGQSQFTAFWTRPRVPLPPWSLGWDARGLLNMPPGRKPRSIKSPWVLCDDDSCWDIVAMALRTTWLDSQKERYVAARQSKRAAAKKAWRETQVARLADGKRALKERRFGRPNLTAAEKQSIDDAIRPHTLLDYLYRLRIRANYEDTTMFEEGPENSNQSLEVHQALNRITSTTLLVHELMLGQLIGREALNKLIEQWARGSRVTDGTGVNARRNLIVQ